MDLFALEAFGAVAWYGSYTEAAKHLFVSQPTLSRIILSLESELEVSLFTRRKANQVVLTKAGELFLESSQFILEEADRTRNQLRLYNRNRRVLSMGLTIDLVNEQSLAMLQTFMAQYPDTEFQIFEHSTLEFLDMLDNHQIDFILGWVSDWPLEKYDVSVLKTANHKLMISTDNPLSAFNPIELSQTKNQPFILPARDFHSKKNQCFVQAQRLYTQGAILRQLCDFC